ncbi:hypothetical protein REPUB_Repub13aG0182900 [Reevesia pubescens]
MGTWNHNKTKLRYCIFVFVVVYHMFSYIHVDGSSISSDLKTIQLAKHKGTIKTIQSEDGDVIDCVDIYKQPAFNHPLLSNHTIQMKPSSYPGRSRAEKFEPELLQGWHKSGQCPDGTIPIVRAQINKPTKTVPFVHQRKNLDNISIKEDGLKHEYAQVSVNNGNYFGVSGRFNIWNPATFDGELSLAQIWVLSGPRAELNTVEAGWLTHAGEKQTQLFIYWTSDGYQSKGCYNIECPGFVQTNNKVALGAFIKPISTYRGKQFEISIYIYKDKKSGNWWFRFQNQDLGYWPGSIFTTLADRADTLTWGGEIVNSESQGRHTSTQMGSGHFPSEGFSKASFIRNLRYMDESGAIKDVDPKNLVHYVSNPPCYDLQMGNLINYGTHFFFGGPGYSAKCQ